MYHTLIFVCFHQDRYIYNFFYSIHNFNTFNRDHTLFVLYFYTLFSKDNENNTITTIK